MSGFWITIAALALALLFLISLYNRLIALKNKVANAFGQIDVQLKRRHDLIPNLVETARAYMTHERSTLEAVVNARNTAQAAGQLAAQQPGDAQALAVMAQAEGALSSTLGRFFALAEAYPELKANVNFLDLQNQLKSVEVDIANARKYFNGVTRQYNTRIQVFPTNIVAGLFNFTKKPLFEVADEAQRQNVKVSF